MGTDVGIGYSNTHSPLQFHPISNGQQLCDQLDGRRLAWLFTIGTGRIMHTLPSTGLRHRQNLCVVQGIVCLVRGVINVCTRQFAMLAASGEASKPGLEQCSGGERAHGLGIHHS